MQIDRRHAAVITLAAAYGVVCVALSPPGPFTAPDSAAYLSIDPIVPPGYSLFLAITGPDAAIRMQPLMFAAALGLLGVEVLGITGSVVIALLVQLGIIAIPGLRDLHASILTESVFMSGLVAFLAAAFWYVRAPSWQRAATAAALVALTATVRRAGLALVPALVVMLVASRLRQRGAVTAKMLAAVIVPLAVILGLDVAASAVLHGDRETSLAGRHIFAKAALLDADDEADAAGDVPQTWLRNALRGTFAPVREIIAAAPPAARPTLTLYYETCLQGPCVTALRERLGDVSEARKNELFAQAGWERVRTAPLGFLRLVATHYALMWTPYHWRHPTTAVELTGYVAAHRPLPFEREAFKVAPGEPLVFVASEGVRVLQIVVAAIGVLTAVVAIWGVAAALRRPTTHAAPIAAAVAALAAHGCLLFSAIGAAGLARFTISVLPAVVTSLGVLLSVIVSARQRRVAGSRGARYH